MINFMSRNYSSQRGCSDVNKPKIAFKNNMKLPYGNFMATDNIEIKTKDEDDVDRMVRLKEDIWKELGKKEVINQKNRFRAFNTMLLLSRINNKNKNDTDKDNRSTVHAVKVTEDFTDKEGVEHKKGDIVGSAALSPLYPVPKYNEHDDIGLISFVYLSKCARGHGNGTALIKHMIKHAKDFGYKKLFLIAVDENAEKAYKKIGFSRIKRRECIRAIKDCNPTIFTPSIQDPTISNANISQQSIYMELDLSKIPDSELDVDA